MTDFTFRLILLAIPGLFAASLYDALNGRRDRSPSSLFLAVVLFSNSAYLLFSLLQILCPGITGGQGEPVFSSLFAETPGIQPGTILLVTLCGVLLALTMTYANTYSLMHRLANHIKATYRYGDQDVWHFLHNMDKQGQEWYFVRDHKYDLIYYGAIKVWSDSEKDREFIMKDVSVFDNQTGEKRYETPLLYVCRSKFDLSIEVVPTENGEEA